ncbi:MAG: SET domain-containing protein-lysine N-methyltransferase, partial [Bacteroidota bacterium]
MAPLFNYVYALVTKTQQNTDMTKRSLVVKKSTLPKSGKGLFTKASISKGELVVEYRGKITTWKHILANKVFNGYVFYVNRNHVVDAMKNMKALGRYANDAKGLSKIKGIRNNADYVVRQGKVYIHATANIRAGDEIFVNYGKEYWDIIMYNKRIA